MMGCVSWLKCNQLVFESETVRSTAETELRHGGTCYCNRCEQVSTRTLPFNGNDGFVFLSISLKLLLFCCHFKQHKRVDT